MPTSTRRQARSRSSQIATPTTSEAYRQEDEVPVTAEMLQQSDHNAMPQEMMEEEEEEEEEMEPFPPLGLKEISSLASWTVSTAKPGSGVSALRSPDTTLFWQSDGPQPHLLSIHFFKLVEIVAIRIYLDFIADESYTPTKILFLAGMGESEVVEFSEMVLEQPRGWIDVDFSNVGPVDPEAERLEMETGVVDWAKRPVLRAFLLQVKILENHQNGKDTHLRALQIFARDEPSQQRRKVDINPRKTSRGLPVRETKKDVRRRVEDEISLAPWMGEPELR